MKNEEKINLREILKDCLSGTVLYSPLFGKVRLDRVMSSDECRLPIVVNVMDSYGYIDLKYFTADGKYTELYESECMLFPSKDCRDWSKFKAPKPEHVFKPFEKVLVRDSLFDPWRAAFFDRRKGDNFLYEVIGTVNTNYRFCIPYESNEHLHNTTNKPNEE